MKNSKDPYYSLDFNKNWSQKLALAVGAQGLNDLGWKSLNLPHLWHHPKKTRVQNFPISKNLN